MTTRTRPRLDRTVLVGNLVAGAAWLVPLAVLSWPLAVIGTAYVVVASLFLAAVYGRGTLSVRQETQAWVAPWLLAVAAWAWVLAQADGGHLSPLIVPWAGVLGTGCYLAWQLSALAARQLLVRTVAHR